MPTLKKQNIPATPYHHGNLANVLKKKALAIIKSKGIMGISLRTLADKCSVSSAAVYRHYESKEHLLAVLAEEGLDVLQTHMKAAMGPKRLQNMGLAYIQFALQDPLRFRLIFQSAIDKTKFPSLLLKHQQTFAIVKEEVENCVKNGTMVGNVDNLTRTAWATAHGIAILLLDNQFTINEHSDGLKIAFELTSIVGRGLARTDIPSI